MALISYQAERDVQPGHVVDNYYYIEFPFSRQDKRIRKIGPNRIALSGSQVSVIHRIDRIWDLASVILTEYGLTNVIDGNEFIESIVGGTQFEIDFGATENMVAGHDFDNGDFNDWEEGNGQSIVDIDQLFAERAYDLGTDPLSRYIPYIEASPSENIKGQIWINSQGCAGDAFYGFSCHNSSFVHLGDVPIASIGSGEDWTEISGEGTTLGATAWIRPYVQTAQAMMTHPALWRPTVELSHVIDGNPRERRIGTYLNKIFSFRAREL